jgi:FKBP-type peptidyl-prolyl cis-trans isomerase SlyD
MKAQIVSFHCVLKDVLGKTLSTTFSQDVITQIPSEAEEVPGLAARMIDLESGEHRQIKVPAKEAYGLYDTKLTHRISVDMLASGEAPVVGDSVRRLDPDGKMRTFRITEVTPDSIQLDANHPLAGQDLIFELHVLEARDATAEEIYESIGTELPRYLH